MGAELRPAVFASFGLARLLELSELQRFDLFEVDLYVCAYRVFVFAAF